MKEYLFAYGLFRDSGRTLLGEFTYCGRASINARLYKVNEFYPGVIIGEDHKTFGDVYLIDTSIFPVIDEYEGDEYTRKKVRTSTDLECWVYEYKHEIKGLKEIPSGDWMLR